MTTTLSAADLVLDTALVKKYDLFGPRYTSYPTADRFNEAFTAEHYVNALHARNDRHATHVPRRLLSRKSPLTALTGVPSALVNTSCDSMSRMRS